MTSDKKMKERHQHKITLKYGFVLNNSYKKVSLIITPILSGQIKQPAVRKKKHFLIPTLKSRKYKSDEIWTCALKIGAA